MLCMGAALVGCNAAPARFCVSLGAARLLLAVTIVAVCGVGIRSYAVTVGTSALL